MLQQTQSPPEVCSKDSYIPQKSGSFVGPHFNECYQSKSMLLAHNGVYYCLPETLPLAIQSPNRIPYWRPYWKHCFLWDGEIGPSVSLLTCRPGSGQSHPLPWSVLTSTCSASRRILPHLFLEIVSFHRKENKLLWERSLSTQRYLFWADPTEWRGVG